MCCQFFGGPILEIKYIFFFPHLHDKWYNAQKTSYEIINLSQQLKLTNQTKDMNN